METPAAASSRCAILLSRRQNPLLRRSDVLRARMAVLLVAAFLAASTVSALLALRIDQRDRAASQRYSAQLHQVRAVALREAGQGRRAVGADYVALVGWHDAAGRAHQGHATVPGTAHPGSRVDIWLDAGGRPAAAPAGEADSAAKATLVALIVLGATTGLLGAGAALVRDGLARADLEHWASDWRRVEPSWARRM